MYSLKKISLKITKLMKIRNLLEISRRWIYIYFFIYFLGKIKLK
jgi:hypothetical protein